MLIILLVAKESVGHASGRRIIELLKMKDDDFSDDGMFFYCFLSFSTFPFFLLFFFLLHSLLSSF